jgi:alkylated DNA repair dioxygenase AlkB
MPPEDLTYLPAYLSEEEQMSLLTEIDSLDWSSELKRRVQHYGYKYDYTKKSINVSMMVGAMPEQCRSVGERMLKEGIFSKMPDQLIVNEYLPGQGITPHVDCVPCFEDTIVSISLGDAYTMEFSRKAVKDGELVSETYSLLLDVGSLVKLQGHSRYGWRHGIAARKTEGGRVRKRRVSLTYRTVILT